MAEGAVSRITSHEQVCAERQGEIRKQLDNLQKTQWGMATGVITILVGVLVQLAMHFFTGK
jgi:predicted nucleic acid-binding Zn ribbon protein